MEKLKNIASFILDTARKQGAEKAYCYVSEREKREFNVDGGEFSLFRTLFDRNVSVTVFKNKCKGSVSINRFDEESVESAVKNCILAAESASPDDAWEIAENIGEKEFSEGALVCDTEKLFERTKEFMSDIAAKHPLIMMEQLIVSYVKNQSVYMSTTGNLYKNTLGFYDLSTMYSAHKGEEATSFYGSDTTMKDLDKRFIDLSFVDSDLTDVENQLGAKPVEGKFVGTVIFTPACLVDTVFGNVASNFASDGTILDGTSIWKDKLGEKVADARISVSFDPSDKRIIGGEKYTGEGYISEKYDFIKDGVLENFMLSQYVANKTSKKRSPNSGFDIVIKNGEKSIADIIKETEKGILVGRFSGGAPGTNGEFSGVAKNGFYIENGKIVSALSETMISGNLADMLFNLVDVSKEVLEDGNLVAPYMAFGGITVSGK